MSFLSGGQGGGDRRPDDRSGCHPAARAAHLLNRALERYGISTQVHEGVGVALVSVCADLVTWTDGSCYFWWSGAVSETTGRRTYNYSPADDPVTTAYRVADRYMELRHGRPLPSPDTGIPLTRPQARGLPEAGLQAGGVSEAEVFTQDAPEAQVPGRSASDSEKMTVGMSEAEIAAWGASKTQMLARGASVTEVLAAEPPETEAAHHGTTPSDVPALQIPAPRDAMEAW